MPILGTGTGFFITEDGYLLTNNHVVKKATTITIKTNGKELLAKVVKVDKQNDLAVLKVDGKFEALPVVSSRKVGLGDEVFTVGFPQIDVQGVSAKYTKGDISSLTGIKDDPRNFQISVPVQPGNSGGPLVNEYGNVVGVVVARLNALKLLKETGRIPQNVNYAVKSSFANSFLESLPKVSNKLKAPNPRTNPRKRSDVIREVQAATVLIQVRDIRPSLFATDGGAAKGGDGPGGGDDGHGGEGDAAVAPGEMDDPEELVPIVDPEDPAATRAVVVNPKGTQGKRYIKMEVHVGRSYPKDKTFEERVRKHAKKLQEIITSELESMTVEDLQNPARKSYLRRIFQKKFNGVLESKGFPTPVGKVVFSKWIIL